MAITSMILGGGWRAVYSMCDDREDVASEAVVAFGAILEGDKSEVFAFVIDDGSPGELVRADACAPDWAHEFLGLLEPGKDIDFFRDEAKRRCKEVDANEAKEQAKECLAELRKRPVFEAEYQRTIHMLEPATCRIDWGAEYVAFFSTYPPIEKVSDEALAAWALALRLRHYPTQKIELEQRIERSKKAAESL
jgi:hypothetical protein